MTVVQPEPVRTFIPHGQSLLVTCPPGCVRGKVYFDGDAVMVWLRTRRWSPTCEELQLRLRCAVCGERPAEVRVISKLYTFKLGVLPGMQDGR